MKLVLTVHNCNASMRLACTVQVVMKAYKACTPSDRMGKFQICLQCYMFCNVCTVMHQAIGSLKKWYALQLQRPCSGGCDRVVLPAGTSDRALVQKALECIVVVDEAPRYIEFPMSRTFHMLV